MAFSYSTCLISWAFRFPLSHLPSLAPLRALSQCPLYTGLSTLATTCGLNCQFKELLLTSNKEQLTESVLFYCFRLLFFEQKDVLTWGSIDCISVWFISFVVLCILFYAFKSSVSERSPQAFFDIKEVHVLNNKKVQNPWWKKSHKTAVGWLVGEVICISWPKAPESH